MIFRTLAYVFLLGSVSWADIPPAPSPGVSAPPELCLFRACMEKSGGSVMISPFSLYEVLRYMLPGAAGETEKQMAAVLPETEKSGGTGLFCLVIFRARCAVIPPTAFLQTGPWS